MLKVYRRLVEMLWGNLLLLSSFLVFSCHGTLSPNEIFRNLMVNHSRAETPGFPDKPTKVKLGVYVHRLQYLGDFSSDFQITIYLRQKWRDPRLVFTSDGQKRTIRLPEDSWSQIWVPDIFIRGARNVKIDKDLSSNRLLRLGSDGEVFYVTKLSAIIPTQFNLKNYPFDKQHLELIFESFGYTMDTLFFKPLHGETEIDSELNLRQFTLRNLSTVDCSMNYTSGAYPCLKVVFAIDRNSCQFVLQFFLPSILIVILSWLSFWLDHETSSPSRLLIGFLSLIALILLNAFADHSNFATQYKTPLNCWTNACYVLVFATLVEFAIVNILSKRPSGVRGLEYLKPPFAAAEKTVEVNGKDANGFGGDGKRKARLVDWFSRIFFPIGFLLFNLIYWIMVKA